MPITIPPDDPQPQQQQPSDVDNAPIFTGALGLPPSQDQAPSAPQSPSATNPRFAPTKMGRLKAGLTALAMGDGLVGAVAGAANPRLVAAQQKRMADLANANVQFQSAQAAHAVATAAAAEREYSYMPIKLQQQAEELHQNTAELLQKAGLPLIGVSDHTNDSAVATLTNLASDSPTGQVPHTINITLPASGKTLTFGTKGIVADASKFNQFRALSGYPPISDAEFGAMKPEKREEMINNAASLWLDAPDEKNVDSMIASVSNAKNLYARSTPDWQTDKAATLKRFDQRLSDLKDNQKFYDQRFVQRETTKQKIHDSAHDTLRQHPSIFGGEPSTLDSKEYNVRARGFKKNADALNKTEQTYDMFSDAATAANAALHGGPDVSGARAVTTLFAAIGLSAEPLAGKGFRINKNTVEEHSEARGLDESLKQKLLKLKAGDIITPQQILDYTSIAEGARRSAYRSTINEARNMELNPDFLMPRGNGRQLDANTQQIFLDAANGDAAVAAKAAKGFGWKF